MRRSILWPLTALCLLLSACNNPAEPENRSIVGEWTSSGFGAAEVSMTLTEVAREVSGAGSWLSPASALAFRVTGTHVEQSVSLLLDFDGAEDINFRGEFTDEDVLAGVLNGGPFRGESIQFQRVEEES